MSHTLRGAEILLRKVFPYAFQFMGIKPKKKQEKAYKSLMSQIFNEDITIIFALLDMQ
jgi:preprotein translocase subunit YajC